MAHCRIKLEDFPLAAALTATRPTFSPAGGMGKGVALTYPSLRGRTKYLTLWQSEDHLTIV